MVPLGVVGKRRRQFLIRTADFRHQPDRPAGARQKGGLDEIVGQDLATERRLARKLRKAGIRHEGFGSDNRVMAPIVAAAGIPKGGAEREQGIVKGGCELLDAGEQRLAANRLRRGLDQTRLRIAVHQTGEIDQRVAGHQAVGVQADEIVVALAPTAAELGDIAGLAPGIVGAIAIEDALLRFKGCAELRPHRLLLEDGVGILAVAQDEDVEGGLLAGRLQRAVNRGKTRADRVRILVIDGHRERGSPFDRSLGRLSELARSHQGALAEDM